MKKVLTTIALAAVVASSSYAQGLVFFSNQNNTKISTNSAPNGAQSGTATGASSYYYALFYSTTLTAVGGSSAAVSGTNGAYAFNTAGWSDSTLIGTNSGATSGRFASSTADSGNNSAVNNLAGVTAAQFVIVGWSANIGNTVASLVAWYNAGNPNVTGWVGESAVTGAITTGNGGTQVTPATMGISAPQTPGFGLGEVIGAPEPGTMALAAIGGASLLLFRRKK